MATVTLGKDSFESMSEACFLVLPESRRSQNQPSKKRKRAAAKNIPVSRQCTNTTMQHGGFQQLFNGLESPECMALRQASFLTSWNKIDTIIKNVLVDMNSAMEEQIAAFVDTAHDSTTHKDGLIALPYHEIPTGLVFAGINTPDHDAQFEHLAQHLRMEPSPDNGRTRSNFVARLQSRDCSNLRSMMKCMIEQFVSSDVEPQQRDPQSDDDDDELDQDVNGAPPPEAHQDFQLGAKVVRKPSRLPDYDMQILEGWYRHVTGPFKASQPNLVVILQDLESFEPIMLQDFITICSEYRLRIPIVLIMGITTSIEILHQSLTKATIGLLRIEKFWLEQSDVWFNRVMEKLLLASNDTLRLGARPYKFILDHFYLYDFSMSKVTASLKYVWMHHFYGNPLSIFLPLMDSSEADAKKTLEEWWASGILSEHHATHLRMLPSFRLYIESLCDTDPEIALALLDQDAYLLTQGLPSLLHGLSDYHRDFQLGFQLICALQAQFSTFAGLRKSKLTLLLDALEAKQGLGESDLVAWLVRLVRKLDQPKLAELLDRLETTVTAYGSEDTVAVVANWRERLQALDEADEGAIARMEKRANALAGMVLPESVDHGRQTETAKKVQEGSVAHLKRKGTTAAKLAMDIADWIQETLSHNLRPYTKIPMYELVYYTSSKWHEKSFAAQPRATVQTALHYPTHYLDCTCCTGDNRGQLQPSQPDTCILYKLYLECGRMINLYDWFVAFGCILEREKRPQGQPLREKEVQARFVRSVAELQFLGFIKPTQRKTDHVMRLTWSNV